MKIAEKKSLYLYLAIACFAGIIAIFIFDGYVGIYDTFYITANEHEQEISPDYWLRSKNRDFSYPYHIEAHWGETVRFQYNIENRRFSVYSTPITASLWKENKKILDMVSLDKSIKPFDTETVEWVLDSTQLQSQGLSADEYTMKVEREGMERNIIIGYYVDRSNPIYTIPTPPQPR